MREMLQQLTAIPGVVGSLACGTRGEILASVFPPVFEEPALRRVAALLAEETGALANVVDASGALDLRYSGGRAVVKRFPSGCLLLVCTSAINPQLLGLSLTHVWRRLEKFGLTPAAPTPVPSAGAAVAPEWEDVRHQLLQALVRRIGPIGEIIMEQAWASWVASGPPSASRLEKLVAALAREIDESDARGEFQAEAEAIIR